MKTDANDIARELGTDELRRQMDGATPVRQSKAARSRKTSDLISLARIKAEATDWLWQNRIPRGAQTISAGEPGVGKSQQQADIIAHVSTGEPWFDGSPCPCGDTIMLTCEDSYSKTIVPRLYAARANLERVHALQVIRIHEKTKRAFLLMEDLDELERHLRALPNALLITIDPITGFFGTGKISSNSVTDIRGALGPLSDLAERRNIAVHTVTHPPKATTTAMNAFIGSQAFVAASRMAYLTVEEKDDEGRPSGRYLLSMVRSSLGPKLPTLAYRLMQIAVGEDHRDGRAIYGSYVHWEGEVNLTADAALAAASGKGDCETKGARNEAMEFLADLLAAGPVGSDEVWAAAKANRIAERTLKRAKKELRVEARHRPDLDGGWEWVLPEGGQTEAKGATKNSGPLREIWPSSGGRSPAPRPPSQTAGAEMPDPPRCLDRRFNGLGPAPLGPGGPDDDLVHLDRGRA